MNATKPTILILPGAWLPSSTYDDFIAHLQKSSFPTRYAPYPSLNPSDPTLADAAANSQHVREKSVLPLVEDEGKEVVVLMHSYGGVPGSAAVKGLGRSARAKDGKKGGVIGLIHVSGFVLAHGISVTDGTGGQLPAWVKENEPYPGLNLPDDPVAIFSADIDPRIAKENASQIAPHATLAITSPSPAPAWTEPGWHGRLAYLMCTEDQAIPKFAQEAMMQGTGMEWKVKEMGGSHNAPFLKKPEETCKMLEDFVEGFLKLDA